MISGAEGTDFVRYPPPPAISLKVFKTDTLGLDFRSEMRILSENLAKPKG